MKQPCRIGELRFRVPRLIEPLDAAIGIGANLHCLSALAPVHDDGLGHLVTRLLCGWQL